jgi:hypothetical protein
MPFLAANPDYNLTDNPQAEQTVSPPQAAVTAEGVLPAVGPNRSSRAPELAQMDFPPLPAAKNEGATLAHLLGQFLRRDVQLLMEANALETCLS